MNAKELAKKASLENTAARVEKIVAEQEAIANQSTALVVFGGIDANTGKPFGHRLDGGLVYFDLETNAVPKVGQTLEVAIARNSLFGKGDARPVK